MKTRAAFAVMVLCAASITYTLGISPAVAAPQDRELVSVSSAEVQGGSNSTNPSVSRDSRFVAFSSDATNLVVGDTNGTTDVFVRDRLLGTTERVTVDSIGAQGNGFSNQPWISGNGQFVAFNSAASNLVAGDTNGVVDIFVHDRQTDATERVSVDGAGGQSNGPSPTFDGPSISADGRYVTFASGATNLVAVDLNGKRDYFLHDRDTDQTELVTVSSTEVQGTGDTADGGFGPSRATVSDDGNFVAFSSRSNNLAGTDLDSSNPDDVFVRNRQMGTTELISVDTSGVAAGRNSIQPVISADGRFVAFSSGGLAIAEPKSNFGNTVYRRDRQAGTTEVASQSDSGGQSGGFNNNVAMSPDGRRIAWATNAFLEGDLNGFVDVFVRDLDTDTTEWVSIPPGGGQGTNHSVQPALSAHPGVAVWLAYGDNLAPGDVNGKLDIIVQHGYDLTPPTITPTVSGTVGANGWYVSDIDVTWTLSDPESAITSQSGCDPTTVSTDTTEAGVTFTCYAMSAALPTSQAVTVKRDATAPTIDHTIVPASPDGSNGWYRSSPTVTFGCEDPTPGSGLLSCLADGEPGPSKSLGESATAQSVAGTATDEGGNVSIDSAQDLLVDLTDPTVTCASPTPTFEQGEAGAEVTAAVSDGISGPEAVSVSAAADTSDLGDFVADVTGRDVAGRSTVASCSYRVRDLPTAPAIGPATRGAGQATVSWTPPGSDGGSPITGYIVTPYIGTVAQPPRRFDSIATQQIVTGLTPGTTYTFKVAAINDVGTGPQSLASNSVRPK